jgi:hypothetical protein
MIRRRALAEAHFLFINQFKKYYSKSIVSVANNNLKTDIK